MIDREARDRFARNLRSLTLGRISNDQYEDNLPKSEDDAVYEIHAQGAWFLYDDFKEHRLTGRYALSAEGRSMVARWIMFLRSDETYEWPTLTGKPLLMRLAFFLSFGIAFRRKVREWKEISRQGDKNYWPFYDQQQYARALKRPTYLGGRRG